MNLVSSINWLLTGLSCVIKQAYSVNGSVKNLHKDVDVDICFFFAASSSFSVSGTSPCMDNSFNSSDSDSERAEPPSKKACREKFQPLARKRRYSKKLEKELNG